jgi:elongation factor G
MHANKQNPIDFIEAGDIGAAVGFKDIKTEIHCVMKTPNYSESIPCTGNVVLQLSLKQKLT